MTHPPQHPQYHADNNLQPYQTNLNSSTSALRAFAHLPSYEFDYDYRGQTIRAPAFNSMQQQYQQQQQHSSFETPALDNFDSYMFPESDSQSSPTTEPSEINTPTYPSTTSDVDVDVDVDDDATNSINTVGTTNTTTNTSIAQLNAIDWSVVDNAHLYAPDGSVLDPCHLYTGYSTYITLIFVPRQAVELCALVYAKLAHLLQQSSTRLVFITAWTPDQATTFLSRFERVAPFPGSVVCDPDVSLFQAFGLTRSPLKALFSGNRVSAPMRQGVRNALSTVSYRAQNRDIGGTSVSSKRLKVGAVVVSSLRGYSKRPTVVYGAEESSSTGVGCYMDVLSACGVNEAFVPDIDVAQLYTRFNSMRTTSQKARHADEKEANRVRTGHALNSRSSRKGGDRRNALKS